MHSPLVFEVSIARTSEHTASDLTAVARCMSRLGVAGSQLFDVHISSVCVCLWDDLPGRDMSSVSCQVACLPCLVLLAAFLTA